VNPVHNPFAPGAGTPPPELAGREQLLDSAEVAIERIRAGRPTKSLLMIGLRGVGKTVLLDRMSRTAEAARVETLRLEAPERRSLPGLLAPQLRVSILRLSHHGKAKRLAQRSLKALAGFAKALKIKYADIEVGLDAAPEPGLADNGDLQQDLTALLETVGAAARDGGTALLMFVDELQYVVEDQLAALITALHRCAQRQLPISLFGAGLPQLRAQTGRAKSYAERLFEFVEVGPLDAAAATRAIVRPLNKQDVEIREDAVRHIVRETHGYPYFLQEWGKHAWDIAKTSPIRLQDVEGASATAVAALDASFFRVRLDRLAPSERRYLRAMAELGAGPHRSGEIAACLDRRVQSLGPTRNALIAKGILWSPAHGDTAFTVPLFDQFMKRTMPGNRWRKE
jgi:hypothetical protein